MPEGPEVETIRRSLEGLLVGRRLGDPWISTKKLRTPIRRADLLPLVGARVEGLARHGKLLLVDVEGGGGLFVRLGMTGRLLVEDRARSPAPHTHLRIPLDPDAGQGVELRFVDIRRFGEVVPFRDRAARDAERARMGPDALLLEGHERERVLDAVLSTSRALKDVLLDQSVLAGVGNIYAAEALFVARLSPFVQGRQLDRARAGALLDAVREVLERGVAHRGTSFSDYVDGRGERGDNLAHLWVFQRDGEPCRVCTTPIVRVVQGQRSTFLCPECQVDGRAC